MTGASKGFGRIWSEAALKRGDKVAAAARKIGDVQVLAEIDGELAPPRALDVTDRDAVFAAVQQAHTHFERIDVVIDNAGYGLFGSDRARRHPWAGLPAQSLHRPADSPTAERSGRTGRRLVAFYGLVTEKKWKA